MTFAPTEMELALREPLDRYLTDNQIFRAGPPAAVDPNPSAMWRAFASELGILGAALPEEVGGLGGGAPELGAVMQVLGRHLVLEPFLSTAVIGASFLRDWSSPEAQTHLADIVNGDCTLALAVTEEGSGYDPARSALQAARRGGDYVLNGQKVIVLDAAKAKLLIVVARTSGAAGDRDGVSVFVVDANAAGLTRRDYRLVDGRTASDIAFADVVVPADRLIGDDGAGLPLVERVLDEATVAVCAEACGVLERLVELTVEYTKQRRQFGRPIAEFQVLQHRMVDMLIESKQASVLTLMARLKLDSPEREAAVSAAKGRVGRACKIVSQSAVQLHGGIGITDEAVVSHYFRKALLIEQIFGSTEYHLDRYEKRQTTSSHAA